MASSVALVDILSQVYLVYDISIDRIVFYNTKDGTELDYRLWKPSDRIDILKRDWVSLKEKKSKL